MSLEAFGDDSMEPGEITTEDLYAAGWQSNPECTQWWRADKEDVYTFADACMLEDESRSGEDEEC